MFQSIMNYVLYYKKNFIGISVEVVFNGTLYEYSLIAFCELISFPCIN